MSVIKRNYIKILFAVLLSVLMCFSLAACDTGAQKNGKFTLSFEVDGKIVKTVKTSGNELILPPAEPVKNGYVFEGWFFDKDTWTKSFNEYSFESVPLLSNTTIYAKWETSHNYGRGVHNAGDCRHKGYTRFTCADCNEYYDVSDSNFGEHSYSEAKHVDGDCRNKGYTTKVCKICGESVVKADEKFGEHKFDYGNGVHTDGNCLKKGSTKYLCPICGESEEVADDGFGSHSYSSETNVCDVCGEIKENEGLLFVLNPDKASYTVSRGSCTESVINVPAFYGNLPVTVVGDFRNAANLKRIVVPEGVFKVSTSAFWYCYNLTAVGLPESLASIGSYAFNNCGNLEEIYVPLNVSVVGEDAFYGCTELKKINCAASDPKTNPDSPACNWHGGWKGNCIAVVYWGYEK